MWCTGKIKQNKTSLQGKCPVRVGYVCVLKSPLQLPRGQGGLSAGCPRSAQNVGVCNPVSALKQPLVSIWTNIQGVGTSVATKFGASVFPKVTSRCVLRWEIKPGRGFFEKSLCLSDLKIHH